MIFVILILSAAATAFLFVLGQKNWLRRLSFVFAAIFLVSIVLIVANFNQHFGMEQENRTQTVNLVSSVDDQNVEALLYKPLGDGTEKTYLYATENMEKPKSAGSDHVKNHIDQHADQAQLTLTKTEWVYKNGFYRFLFGLSGNNHEFIKQENQFKLPPDWEVLSTE
ncbi:DUF4811 domain-containing protein [Tetragenococcus koreensis]|uniref:DUF4811 domain-containing protein n=1 Tax=Tetragenococcus koreensis TaxID=290335 RepID=UPI000F4FD69F|nr:DUF4811 domain-containing protein [Tetragenococcus koreensis]AYW46008.1 DUF4811 domain-containing protein [Tetragenococcus koreensis]GEN90942.1 hypothetical protein TKO01_09880 [Tetragenococcus koreensis]